MDFYIVTTRIYDRLMIHIKGVTIRESKHNDNYKNIHKNKHRM